MRAICWEGLSVALLFMWGPKYWRGIGMMRKLIYGLLGLWCIRCWLERIHLKLPLRRSLLRLSRIKSRFPIMFRSLLKLKALFLAVYRKIPKIGAVFVNWWIINFSKSIQRKTKRRCLCDNNNILFIYIYFILSLNSQVISSIIC